MSSSDAGKFIWVKRTIKRNYCLGDHKIKRHQETFLQGTESFMHWEIKNLICTI